MRWYLPRVPTFALKFYAGNIEDNEYSMQPKTGAESDSIMRFNNRALLIISKAMYHSKRRHVAAGEYSLATLFRATRMDARLLIRQLITLPSTWRQAIKSSGKRFLETEQKLGE